MIADVQNQELTVNNQTSFPALPTGLNDIALKIGENYAEVTGIAIVTASTPVAATGILTVSQSADGGNFDQIDSFSLTDGGSEVAFSIRILSRFVRVQFEVPAATQMSLRLGGLLKVGT